MRTTKTGEYKKIKLADSDNEQPNVWPDKQLPFGFMGVVEDNKDPVKKWKKKPKCKKKKTPQGIPVCDEVDTVYDPVFPVL
tara:strand:- start:731 stop:973 length:243 start_codon:yes stop_codon:yes gene_type:complete